jgi:hypothetical protein
MIDWTISGAMNNQNKNTKAKHKVEADPEQVLPSAHNCIQSQGGKNIYWTISYCAKNCCFGS